MNIIELEKVTEDENDVILHFVVPKDMLNAFQKVFHGFLLATESMSYKIRTNETVRQAHLEAHRKEVQGRFEVIKEEIRTAYRAEFKHLKETRKAFKNVRKKFKHYGFLVSEVQKEIRAKRELEILRLHNSGFTSFKIGDILSVSPGYIRKTIWKNQQNNIV